MCAHILEKLILSKNKKTQYTLFPKTKAELKEMIKAEIEQFGNECSLNHIDVSKIDNMDQLFFNSDFDGDISEWKKKDKVSSDIIVHSKQKLIMINGKINP